jgi:hypothetical protein
MDHDACSRLLHAYITGEAGEDARAIARHLQDCRQCQVERAGLEMLLAPVDPLTEAERARLHVGVAAATRPPATAPSRPAPVPAGDSASRRPPGRQERPSGPGDIGSRRQRRVAPAFSAAAAILLVVSGVILFQHVDTGYNRPSTSGAANGAAHAPESARSQGGGKPGALSSLPLPAFSAARFAGIEQVQRQATPLAAAFARAYGGSQVERLAPLLLHRLEHLAPPDLRSQVQQCGDRFLRTSRTAAVPLFGSRTTIDKTPALALAFASSSSPGEPLTRVLVTAWPLGSCGGPLAQSNRPIGG